MNATGERRPIPAWLWYSLLTILLWGLWGFQSKIITERLSPVANQILSTPGLLVLALILMLRRARTSQPDARRRRLGIFFAFLTGILGGTGNIAFFEALHRETQASVVVPMTALYPMVTVLLAMLFLKERMNLYQWVGLGLAIAAIIVLGL